jgi:hypothetical protein
MGSRPNRPRGRSKKRNVFQISVSRHKENNPLEEGGRGTRTKLLEFNLILKKEDERERERVKYIHLAQVTIR